MNTLKGKGWFCLVSSLIFLALSYFFNPTAVPASIMFIVISLIILSGSNDRGKKEVSLSERSASEASVKESIKKNNFGSIACWVLSAALAVAFIDGILDIVPAMQSMSSKEMFYPFQAMLAVLTGLFLCLGFLVRYRLTGPTPHKEGEQAALVSTSACAAMLAIMFIPAVF